MSFLEEDRALVLAAYAATGTRPPNYWRDADKEIGGGGPPELRSALWGLCYMAHYRVRYAALNRLLGRPGSAGRPDL